MHFFVRLCEVCVRKKKKQKHWFEYWKMEMEKRLSHYSAKQK